MGNCCHLCIIVCRGICFVPLSMWLYLKNIHQTQRKTFVLLISRYYKTVSDTKVQRWRWSIIISKDTLLYNANCISLCSHCFHSSMKTHSTNTLSCCSCSHITTLQPQQCYTHCCIITDLFILCYIHVWPKAPDSQ